MKYAQTGVRKFEDGDGDSLVLREEPTGAQYDQRTKMLGGMRIPAKLIDENKAMGDLFKTSEMIEINMDKEALAEFQFKALFVEMTIGGRTITSISDAVSEYRKFNQVTKQWIDEQTDSVWKAHEEDAETFKRAEGESEKSPRSSSVAAPLVSDESVDVQT
jgi:hypothetical protein